VPAAVFEPLGRNDLLRRVRKDFDGEPLVLPPCPTKAKSKGEGGEGSESGGGDDGGGGGGGRGGGSSSTEQLRQLSQSQRAASQSQRA
jgi:uncharacterized membrane protein YgcG